MASFVTLATGSAFAGINLGLTKAVPFYKLPPASSLSARAASGYSPCCSSCR